MQKEGMTDMTMKCTDHLGNEFPSINAMCVHWGVNMGAYKYRITKGMSVEQALTGNKDNKSLRIDHLGHEFPSVKSMCDHWGIDAGTYLHRIRAGESIKDALTRPKRPKYQKCIDHLGQEFKSIKDLCKYWNVDTHIYVFRIKKVGQSKKH